MNSWIQLHDWHLNFETILHMKKKPDIILFFQAEAHKKHQNTLEVWSQQPSFATRFSDKDSFVGTSTHRRPRRRCGRRQAESSPGDLQLSRLHYQWQSRVPVSHRCPWQCCKHYCLYHWLLLIGGYVRCGQNLRFSERNTATLASPLSFCIVFKSYGFRQHSLWVHYGFAWFCSNPRYSKSLQQSATSIYFCKRTLLMNYDVITCNMTTVVFVPHKFDLSPLIIASYFSLFLSNLRKR